MKLQDVVNYLNDLLKRRPEYGKDEIDAIRTDGKEVKISFAPKYVNPLQRDREIRQMREERLRRLQELSQPDKCFCDTPEQGEFIGTERRDGAPYVEYVDVNIYRCKKCGKLFDDASAIA